MAKFDCMCGELIRISGAMPNPIEWLFVPDERFADLRATNDELYEAATHMFRCPVSDHLYVFWDGFDHDQTCYSPVDVDGQHGAVVREPGRFGVVCACGRPLDRDGDRATTHHLWIANSDTRFDDTAADAAELYRDGSPVLRCPGCRRLVAFWDGPQHAPRAYAEVEWEDQSAAWAAGATAAPTEVDAHRWWVLPDAPADLATSEDGAPFTAVPAVTDPDRGRLRVGWDGEQGVQTAYTAVPWDARPSPGRRVEGGKPPEAVACPCGHLITGARPGPAPERWAAVPHHHLDDPSTDPSTVRAVATTLLRCPFSGHLLVFWDASRTPTTYARSRRP